MKIGILAGAVALALLSCGAAAAQDRTIGEDAPWRFQTPGDRSARQNGLTLYELNRNGYFDQIRMGNMGALAGAGGLLGATSGNVNNQFTFIDQSTTTNNCSSAGSGVGSTLTCGRGDNTVTGVTQDSRGNTNTSTTTVTGNTVTNRDNQNQTNVNTGNGTQTTTGPSRPAGSN
jgi:hypothetical protein